MTDLGRQIASAVRPDWNELREEVAWAGVRLRQRRRVVARIGLVCMLAAAFGGFWMLRPRSVAAPVAGPIPQIHAPPTPPVRIEAPETITTPERVTVELERGTRRFDVDATRIYEVRSGPVTVEAQNAVFACSRFAGGTHVEVFRGSVLVRTGDHQRQLIEGEHAEFSEPRSPPAPAVRITWRDLARRGDYERAYAAFDQARNQPEDLLLIADVMRLSHHPAEALEPLNRVVREHANDPRASLAAFTLGRVLLEELGRPGEAADAFAAAIRLAPKGPMVEDAIAREVEALSRAGEVTAAQQRAEDYLRLYPNGRKVRSVRRFGGLE